MIMSGVYMIGGMFGLFVLGIMAWIFMRRRFRMRGG